MGHYRDSVQEDEERALREKRKKRIVSKIEQDIKDKGLAQVLYDLVDKKGPQYW